MKSVAAATALAVTGQAAGMSSPKTPEDFLTPHTIVEVTSMNQMCHPALDTGFDENGVPWDRRLYYAPLNKNSAVIYDQELREGHCAMVSPDPLNVYDLPEYQEYQPIPFDNVGNKIAGYPYRVHGPHIVTSVPNEASMCDPALAEELKVQGVPKGNRFYRFPLGSNTPAVAFLDESLRDTYCSGNF